MIILHRHSSFVLLFVSWSCLYQSTMTMALTVIRAPQPNRQRLFTTSSSDPADDINHQDRHFMNNNNANHQDDELLQAEQTAAWDGHDAIDAAMETAAEERALMMAQDLVQKLSFSSSSSSSHQQQDDPQKEQHSPRDNNSSSYDEQHVAHGIHQVHVENNAELHEAQELAAWDGHDGMDAGMETAAEERAVMMAAELLSARRRRKEEHEH